MEKQVKHDCRSLNVDVSKGITIEEFNEKYNQIISQLKDKYGYITDIKIHPESGTYNDGEDCYEEIDINYKRYETDEEFEKRKNWIEHRKKEQKERELELMKEYINSNPADAIKYIKELGIEI